MKITKVHNVHCKGNSTWSILSYGSSGEYVKDVKLVEMGTSCGQDKGSWHGTDTMNEAIELATRGWTEIAEKMNAGLKVALKNQSAQQIVKSVQDVAGFQVNVPLFMTGVPTNMIRQQRVKQKSRVINLVKPMGANATVNVDEYVQSGIEAMTVVAALERCGYSVNLYIMSNSSRRKYDSISVLVKIKNANERLNVSKLAFFLANVAVHRRFNFTLYTKYSAETGCGTANKYDATGSTQGHKVAMQLVKKLEEEKVLSNCYVLSGVHRHSSAQHGVMKAQEQVELIKKEFEK